MNKHKICSSGTSKYIFFIIFLATVIPTIIVYCEHAIQELESYNKSIAKGDNYKATKQLGEATLFILISIGYIIGTILVILVPQSRIPYLVLIIGTIAVIILWLVRIYGIPIPFTDVILRDMSTDWRDVITKSCQTIMLIPLTILLTRIKKS